MGRAIDMENDISALKLTVRGMISKLDELDDRFEKLDNKSTKTKHIDLTEVKNDKKETKKSNDKGNNKSDKSGDSGNGTSKKRISDLEFITESYHDYKGEKPGFTKYLHKKIEKLSKDRDSSGIPDNRRQKVSKSAQSTNS